MRISLSFGERPNKIILLYILANEANHVNKKTYLNIMILENFSDRICFEYTLAFSCDISYNAQ